MKYSLFSALTMVAITVLITASTPVTQPSSEPLAGKWLQLAYHPSVIIGPPRVARDPFIPMEVQREMYNFPWHEHQGRVVHPPYPYDPRPPYNKLSGPGMRDAMDPPEHLQDEEWMVETY